jgi:hypothetical protein
LTWRLSGTRHRRRCRKRNVVPQLGAFGPVHRDVLWRAGNRLVRLDWPQFCANLSNIALRDQPRVMYKH